MDRFSRIVVILCAGALSAAAVYQYTRESERRATLAADTIKLTSPKSGTHLVKSEASKSGVQGNRQVEQLLALEAGLAANDPVARSKRQALLMEWFQSDFTGALAYCKALDYEDLQDPNVAQYIARTATIDQLADIVANCPTPFEITRNLCIGAGVEKVQQLMQTADRYTGEAGKGFASGVSVYLAEKNIDAAILFAGSRANEEQRSAAVASVVDQLATEGKNSEVQFLYEALDQKLRETDPVKFAYGKSLHDADPETALGLLYSIQDSALRQVAVLSFARKVEAAQPGVAVSAVLASGISQSAQSAQVERIVSDWLVLDNESARNWLNSANNLPAELRTRLEAKVK